MNTAHWDIEAHSAGPSAVRDLGAAGAVPAGSAWSRAVTLPYRPEALAKKKENFANRLKLDPEIKCYLPGVPRATYMPFPFQIIQGAEHVMLVHEFAGAVRTVYMKDHIEAPADSWMGWSNGRWEGESARRRHARIQRSQLVRSRGKLPQRCAARGRALHASQRGNVALRGHHRGS